MSPGDPITICYLITAFNAPLTPLTKGTKGTYLRSIGNADGWSIHEVEINGLIYPLREGEFESGKVEPAQEYDNM